MNCVLYIARCSLCSCDAAQRGTEDGKASSTRLLLCRKRRKRPGAAPTDIKQREWIFCCLPPNVSAQFFLKACNMASSMRGIAISAALVSVYYRFYSNKYAPLYHFTVGVDTDYYSSRWKGGWNSHYCKNNYIITYIIYIIYIYI